MTDLRLPPATSLSALGAVWTLRADKAVLRDGVATNGNGIAIWWHAGKLYVRTPRAIAHWYQWLGANTWADVGADIETEWLRSEVVRLQALVDAQPASQRIYLSWAELRLPQPTTRGYLSAAKLTLSE